MKTEKLESKFRGVSHRQNVWKNIIFFAFTAAVAFIGGPFYVAHFGIKVPTLILTGFYMVATGMAITAGYHRLFAHCSYKANAVIQWLYLFFGAAAFEQSAFRWSSQHRDHHLYVDTDQDPYDIKKGFFYAHIGWLMFWRPAEHFENAHDLQKNAVLMHQHVHYRWWAIVSGALVPTLIGALWGDALGAFVFAVCVRTVAVHHATFCINSVCHMFGKATYDIYSSAKDHWLVALITNGEGYHNFHHRFPSDYRNAVRWYQWDPTKWLIASLAWMGLASDLKRISKFRILEARLKADQQRLRDWFSQTQELSQWEKLSHDLEARFQNILQTLVTWEARSHEYRELLGDKIRTQSAEIKALAAQKMKVARQSFQSERQAWQSLVQSHAGLARLV